METASAGMPFAAASIAAPMVPEVVNSDIPRFSPMFIPDTTRSGFSSATSYIPMIKASVGVPETEYAVLPSASLIVVYLIGSKSVKA